jgi:hypothetical protein
LVRLKENITHVNTYYGKEPSIKAYNAANVTGSTIESDGIEVLIAV